MTLNIDPARTALLLMDYQNGLVEMIPSSEALLTTAGAAVSWFRAHGGHVGYVRVAFTDADFEAMPAHAAMSSAIPPENRSLMHVDAPTTAIPAQIAPEAGDIVVRKTRVGALSTTDLDAQLRDRGISTLVLAGITTSGVVLSTIRDAADRDYRIAVLADACADPDLDVHRSLLEKIFPAHAHVLTSPELFQGAEGYASGARGQPTYP